MTASFMGTGKHSRWLTGGRSTPKACLARRIGHCMDLLHVGSPGDYTHGSSHCIATDHSLLPQEMTLSGCCQCRLCNKIQQCCNSARRPVLSPSRNQDPHSPTHHHPAAVAAPPFSQRTPHAHVQSRHNTPEHFQVDKKQMACQQGRHQSIEDTAVPTTQQHAYPAHRFPVGKYGSASELQPPATMPKLGRNAANPKARTAGKLQHLPALWLSSSSIWT